MAEPQTPFAGLLTSDALKQKRFQEVMAMAGADPNRQMFAKNLFNFQERLREGGVGLTREDMKARRNDTILQGASASMNARIKDGQADPQAAMRTTLEEAFQQMLMAGDAESAAILAPKIFALRAQDQELEKLKAETAYVKSRPELEATKAEAAMLRAQIAEERVDAQRNLDRARADLADRTDPNLRRGGGGSGNTTNNGFTKFRSQGGSVVGLLNQLGDLYDIYIATPGVASQPATAVTAIADSVKGAKELVAPENKAYNFDLASTLMSQQSSQIAGLAKSLNVDRGLLESTVIDTAYTLARARDPGGRISNADFDNAIRLLGAARDPARAKAVLLDLGRRTARDFQNQAAANPDFTAEPVIGQVADAYQALLTRAKGGKPEEKKTPAPAKEKPFSEMTDEELKAIANGG
jgi:hypothetical protein